MATLLMAAFDSPEQADQALYELEHFGYTPKEISVISKSDRYEGRDYNNNGGNVARSAVSGAATGGVIGGLAGLLAGVGIIPALAGLFIGGPIAIALGLAGAAATTVSGAVTGAAAGGLIGALMGIGVPRETATEYDSAVNNGGVVLGLSGHEGNSAEARTILEKHGAHNIQAVEQQAARTEAGMADRGREAERMNPRREPAFGERIDADGNATETRPADNPKL